MTAPPIDPTTITLKNPVSHHFAAFIFGNATICESVVTENEALGQTLVICGAGPTLNETAAKFCPRGDQVWGCNSAVTWLVEHGHKVTHAFTVDQTAHMVAEWASAPDVEYLVASTVHPHLVPYLTAKGRQVRFFHNYVGVAGGPVSYSVCQSCQAMGDSTDTACKQCGATDLDANTTSYEDWLYSTLYPATIRTGSGLNATTRAIDLALFMGFKKIYLLGADCCLKVNKPMPAGTVNGSAEHTKWLTDDVVMHADGGSALASQASSVTLEGVIDGRHWLTKPDMMITAIWLRSMKKALGSRLSIIGDTLPRAILNKPDEFVERLPNLIGHDGKPWIGKFEERVA
jgi:hypothetical protein